ncbi:MAG: hypothetical protein ACJAXF_001450 [Polaribacter sp.]|jgi:hypothetical protein
MTLWRFRKFVPSAAIQNRLFVNSSSDLRALKSIGTLSTVFVKVKNI